MMADSMSGYQLKNWMNQMSHQADTKRFGRGMEDARDRVMKAWEAIKSKEVALSNEFFWQLAGLFDWEGRKLEDIEVTFKLQTDKPVQICVQYKDHGKEMYTGDAETTTEFALVLEQYELKLTDRVEERQKK